MTNTPEHYNYLPQELLESLRIGETEPTKQFVSRMMELTRKSYVPFFIAIARLEEVLQNTEVRHGSDMAKFLDDNLNELYVLEERQEYERNG